MMGPCSASLVKIERRLTFKTCPFAINREFASFFAKVFAMIISSKRQRPEKYIKQRSLVGEKGTFDVRRFALCVYHFFVPGDEGVVGVVTEKPEHSARLL